MFCSVVDTGNTVVKKYRCLSRGVQFGCVCGGGGAGGAEGESEATQERVGEALL